MIEEWRPVPENPSYDISNIGRVRSGDRIKTTWPDIRGYAKVKLWSQGKAANRSIHRLVAEAFIGPIPAGMAVCHNNGINTDNRATNLRIATYTENEADKKLHGTHLEGSAHGRARLTERQVVEIRARYNLSSNRKSSNIKELAQKYAVPVTTIYAVITRRTWKHIN